MARSDGVATADREALTACPPIDGVLFDYHSTVVDGGDPHTWIAHGWAFAGRNGTAREVWSQAAYDRVADVLLHIWEHGRQIDPRHERDLSPVRHREVFDGIMTLLPEVDAALTDGLYATMVDQWVEYDDAVPVVRALKTAGIRVGVLSNVGFDVREAMRRQGLLELVDSITLSFEAGVVKPGAGIFQRAVSDLATPIERTLMVGDTWTEDGAAAGIGLRTLLLPRTRGPVHGLGLVLRMLDLPADAC